ncbi:MAG: guanine deaminase [Legionellales bacterium]|nr:guanine deaminase [Legionellales bacterium]
MMNNTTAYRGNIFYFNDTASLENLPKHKNDTSNQYVYIEDGILIVKNGKIDGVGSYATYKDKLSDIKVENCGTKLITPGFIDTHQHSTQSSIVAAYGEKLLEWLEDYVFPGERIYADHDCALKDMTFFLDHLLRNGTTTAVSYGPLFYDASDLFFAELNKRNMRFITGNILMDINAPATLKLSTQENYDISKKLIDKWHNKGRLSYCISPRFALATSEAMMELCGELKKAHPDLYIQTHLNENTNEVKEVKKLYPWSKNYLDVYDHFGLITDKTVLGHCIHMLDEELAQIRDSGAIVSWCPISNNFLGSGLFNYERTLKFTDKITLGTDWGGGNSLSMFAVMDDAYKVSMLNNQKLPSMHRWFLATYGAAKTLQIDSKVGNFDKGKEADFIIIDPDASPFLKYRRRGVEDIFELLFILMTLGDEKIINSTYIMGECAYRADK